MSKKTTTIRTFGLSSEQAAKVRRIQRLRSKSASAIISEAIEQAYLRRSSKKEVQYQCCVGLSVYMDDQLRDAARELGVSVSKLIRDAIDHMSEEP